MAGWAIEYEVLPADKAAGRRLSRSCAGRSVQGVLNRLEGGRGCAVGLEGHEES